MRNGDSMSGNGHPLCIQVHQRDNVAIVANEGGLPSGAQFDSGLTLVEAIPEAHKVALVDIPQALPSFVTAPSSGLRKRHRERQLGARRSACACLRPRRSTQLPLATAVPRPHAAAGRLHLRRLPQRRWLRRNEEHSRHRHHRAVRRCHGRIRGQAHPVGASAPLPQRR